VFPPPDYFLISKLKIKLKGLHFGDSAEIKETVTDALNKVQKRGIFDSFTETVRPHTSPIYDNGARFE
jgi:hypothetical protein